ncbi:hypothetical protein [Flavobacterium sp.]|uniref:hypothetical protein n=1 Tax=Flavobacterium sp. TaxID=239 RepID=UPI0039E55440
MKRLSTSAKIKFLQNYIKEWHKEWHKKHPENIVGFTIARKKTGEIERRNYSIVFHVREKQDNSQLSVNAQIPPHFKIEFPDGKKRVIKTDVVMTGDFELQYGIASQVDSRFSNLYGSAGLFVTDNEGRVFMITNYHVVAEDMIRNGDYYYRRPDDQRQSNVRIRTNSTTHLDGRFEEGIISHEVDVAFVELPVRPNGSMNALPGGNRVRGKVTARPYPPAFKDKPLIVYSFHNKNGRNGFIADNSAVFYTKNPHIYFEDLIRITPKITQSGDSGGLVLTPRFAVLGLVVGGDDQSSFAIPFYKIEDFKQLFLI